MLTLRRFVSSLVPVAFVALMWMSAGVSGQVGPKAGDWPTYGGDLASRRYRPFDQINRANFNELEVAWRFKTDALGPRPEFNFQATPLMVNGVLYTPAGSRRAVVALDAATGEMLWMHREDEGKRGEGAPRRLSGRGVAYWTDGKEERIVYVTPGYQMIALDAKTGRRVPGFGKGGAVDLKLDIDQKIDLETGEIGLHAAPIIAKDVIIVGAAHLPGGVPKSRNHEKGYIRGYDARTGKRLWIFHTLPQHGEFGNETWEQGSWEYTGNVGVWAQMTVDEELGMVYLPVELPTGDYYGGHRPGAGLFGESLVALDLKTGRLKWYYQLVHHGIWDFDIPCAPILADITVNGKTIKAIAQPTKQNWLYVFDRVTGQPVWPIEERPVPKGDVPGEWYSPTQPFVTKPPAYDLQGVSIDDLIDFTPELRAEAIKLVSRYKIGPLFTPPPVSKWEGPLGLLMVPSSTGGTNWPGGALDPETNILYVYSFRNPSVIGLEQRSRAIGHGVHQRRRRATRTPRRPPPARLRRRWRRWRAGADRAGASVAEAAVRDDQRHRSEQGRDRVEGGARRHARRGAEPSRPEGDEHPAHRPRQRPHRHAGDQDAGDRRRARLQHAAQRPARRDAARVRQGHRSRRRRGADAGAADWIADDLHVERQAVSGRRDLRRHLQRGARGVQGARVGDVHRGRALITMYPGRAGPAEAGPYDHHVRGGRLQPAHRDLSCLRLKLVPRVSRWFVMCTTSGIVMPCELPLTRRAVW